MSLLVLSGLGWKISLFGECCDTRADYTIIRAYLYCAFEDLLR